MTVQKTTSKNSYIGDGVTKVFPITFEYNTEHTEYIHVYVRSGSEELIEVHNYNLDAENNCIIYPVDTELYNGEGELIVNPPLAIGDTITIIRNIPLKQEMNLVNQGAFFAESIETAFDEVTMMVQQVQEQAERALTISVDSTDDPNTVVDRLFNARDYVEEQTTVAELKAQEAANSAANAAQSAIDAMNAKQFVEDTADTVIDNINQVKDNALTEINDGRINAVEQIEGTASRLIAPLVGAEQRALSAADRAEASETVAAQAKDAAETARDVAIDYSNQAFQNATNSANSASLASSKASMAETAKNDAERAADQANAVVISVNDRIDAAVEHATNLAEDAADRAAHSAELAFKSSMSVDVEGEDLIFEEGGAGSPLAEQVAQNTENIALQSGDIVDLQRKVSVLQDQAKGILYRFESDETEAYSKAIPSGAKVFDLKSIGGKSVVENQLLLLGVGKRNDVVSGITQIVDNDLYITLSGTTTSGYNFGLNANNLKVIKDHKYYIGGIDECVGVSLRFYDTSISKSLLSAIKNNSVLSGLENSNIGYVYFNVGATGIVVSVKVKPYIVDLTQMFGAGNEPTLEQCQQIFTEYIPYTEPTIKSIACDSVSVGGRNLLLQANAFEMKSDTASYTHTYNETNKPSIIEEFKKFAGKTIYYSCKTTGTTTGVAIGQIRLYVPDSSNAIILVPNQVKTLPNDLSNLKTIIWYGSNTGAWSISDVMIAESDSEIAYSPYKPPQQIPIPSSITSLEGYGWSAGTVYNEVDFENKVFIQRVGRVDLGSLNWTSYDASGKRLWISPIIDDVQKPISENSIFTNCIHPKYISKTWNTWSEIENSICCSNTKKIGVFNGSTTVKPSGILYYELAEPIVTDISDLLDESFNAIECEGNGSITFKNPTDYKVPIPNSEEFLVYLNEVN